MYAEIIINNNVKALNRIFDYIIPDELINDVRIGSRVFVPFGNGNKLYDGFVINIKENEESKYKIKPIAKVEEKDSLTEFNIHLAKLMARKYFCNISECIKLMLPPGTGTNDVEKRAKEKTGNFVFIKDGLDSVDKLVEDKKIKSDKQIALLRYLEENNINKDNSIYITELEEKSNVSKSVMKTLEKNGFIVIREEQIERNPFVNKNIIPDEAKVLNDEQRKCFESIKFCIENDEFSKNLIYGITGSGKTEIYLQLINEVLNRNKTAIVLVPEISLTPQMVDRFLARFGDTVAVLHSKLSVGERYDEWMKIASGDKKIVIGARSAIFAPVKDLGIIIIDEEHDMSYKSDSSPRYNAKDLAKYICEISNCPLVLGSATPDITTMYQAKSNDIALYTLTKRATNASLPNIEIVDLRDELKLGNKSMISYRLQEAIKKNLEDKKQTILFLNRRGYSTFIMCRDCGYVAKCKNCNISLTYHMKENKLKCHYCGYEQPVIKECPECHSDKVRYFGTGTQKLETEIHKLFPEASTIRMDIDTVSKKNSHEEILNSFKNDGIDILIGTQMVVKGHHFPNVTLVGVVSADGSLNLEDYRAVEKTFQTLVQVSGRSGREQKGNVIIQTYNPDHYAIIDSQKQDYDLFYNQELSLRKMLKYPPFCDIIMISLNGSSLSEIQLVGKIIYSKIKSVNDDSITIFEPVPSPIDKIKNKLRWRILIKCKITNRVIDIVNYGITDERISKAKYTRVSVDINPNIMS